MRLHSLLPLLVCSSVAGCSVAATDDVDSSEAAVAVARVDACADPVPSLDGQYVVLHTCAAAGGSVQSRSIVRMSVAAVSGFSRMRTIARYADGDEVKRFGVGAGFAWFITKHPSGAWDVTIRDLALATPERTIVPVFPEGTTPADAADIPYPEDIVATSAGHLVFTSGRGDRLLFVVDVADRSTVMAPIQLGGTGFGHDLLPSPDGKRVLVQSIKQSNIETLRTLDLAGTAPQLGAPVAIGLRSAKLFRGSYDGRTFFASGHRAETTDYGTVAGVVDVATGAMTVLSESIDSLQPIATRGAYAWYSARRWDFSVTPRVASYVIERVARDGSAPVRTIARSATGVLRGTLSTDGSTVLTVAGFNSQLKDLGVVPADGSAPLRVVRSSKRLDVRATSAGRQVLTESDPTTGGDITTLVDDVTGAALETYPGYLNDVDLAADGSAVFSAHSCRIGTLPGTEVRRVSGGGEILIPCALGPYVPSLTAIPGTGSMIYARKIADTDDAATKQVVLINP